MRQDDDVRDYKVGNGIPMQLTTAEPKSTNRCRLAMSFLPLHKIHRDVKLDRRRLLLGEGGGLSSAYRYVSPSGSRSSRRASIQGNQKPKRGVKALDTFHKTILLPYCSEKM